MFAGLLSASILKRAVQRGLLVVELLQIRDFAENRHHRVDDGPFGGGPGMVLKVDVLDRAMQSLLLYPRKTGSPSPLNEHQSNDLGEQKGVCLGDGGAENVAGYVVYLSPQGKPFDQDDAKRLALLPHVILVCGHYEGVDERFVNKWVDEEISLGDFVLTGGEIPAMAVIDAVARLRPGVLGDEASFASDSFYHGLLDHPHYTRPATWPDAPGKETPAGREGSVPAVLLSGDHGAVDQWRRRQALLRTLIRRPDWLQRAELTRVEKRLIEKLAQDLDELDSPCDDSQ